MERREFEAIVEEIFEQLPELFRSAIENVGVVVEEYPEQELVRALRLRSKHELLGLYQGIPLTSRGSWYGTHPVAPDKITLYQNNIEARGGTGEQLRSRIYDVLIHEIGHYFGMSEEQVRAAGY